MANLTINVQVGGVPGTSLTVKAWPQSIFLVNPGRGAGVPNTAATATGTTDGSGNVTLTGLSSVPYNILVVDARGVNNWFIAYAAYIGGSMVATIPWTTPTSVTHPVSSGGDTPGIGAAPTTLRSPFSADEHFHEIPASASGPGQQWLNVRWSGPITVNTGTPNDLSGGSTISSGGSNLTLSGGSTIIGSVAGLYVVNFLIQYRQSGNTGVTDLELSHTTPGNVGNWPNQDWTDIGVFNPGGGSINLNYLASVFAPWNAGGFSIQPRISAFGGTSIVIDSVQALAFQVQ